MAPTETLARQHFNTLEPWARAAGVEIVLLTGRDKGKARQAILGGLASGATPLVVGTHALFQEDVAFRDLAMAVIDEQHRFGVHQRLTLTGKGTAVDVLVMTATPIPRPLMQIGRAHACTPVTNAPPVCWLLRATKKKKYDKQP